MASPEMIPSSVNTALAVASLIISVITVATVVYSSATRIAKIELKVETMWAFQMRRGAAEAINQGLATMESPLCFYATVLALLDPIKDQLRTLAAENPFDSNLDLLFKIERAFGVDLLVDFCLPMRASTGACTLAALQVATGRAIDPLTELGDT